MDKELCEQYIEWAEKVTDRATETATHASIGRNYALIAQAIAAVRQAEALEQILAVLEAWSTQNPDTGTLTGLAIKIKGISFTQTRDDEEE